MMIDKVSALKKSTLFQNLDDDKLKELALSSHERKLQQNEILFSAGEEAHGLFVIVSGSVRAYRESVDGREQILHVERAGFTIAELIVFDEGTYPATVAAEEDSVLLFVNKQAIRKLCLDYPPFALTALQLMSQRLRRHAELIETLSLREVRQRLAQVLLVEAQLHGKPTPEGIVFARQLSNQQLAARIGSVRDVASRALTRLQQDELILISEQTITILDEALLKIYAENN